MQILANDDKKIVTIWLTKEEQEDHGCASILEHLIRSWREKQYYPVIFRSGTEDLYDSTLALLKYNKRRSAEREVQQAKQVVG